ncbi:ROK family protein [Streptomyces sp. NPDC005303]|uniref:ROK family protein n=1 Tax=Streptomyces sp. NPDC005303 TaxID=3155713 RepID=UPI0033B55551
MSSQDTAQLGIDVGGTHVKWALTTEGEVVRTGEEPTARQGGDALVDQLGGLVNRVGAQVDLVGLAMPGLVDTVRRETLFVPNLPGDWDRCPVAERVEKRVAGVRVRLLNDARAFGYGELRLGAGRGALDALFVTVGTGVGGALARDGDIVIRAVDRVPELGHLAVDPFGERCGCGAVGCLETVASASALVGRCARAVLTGQSAVLHRLSGGSLARLTARMCAEAADEGDPWALDAFARVGGYLGMAVANACVLLQTPVVVVGGGLSGAFHHIAPAAERVLAERVDIIGPVRLLKAELGSHAGAVGAALYAGASPTGARSPHLSDAKKHATNPAQNHATN